MVVVASLVARLVDWRISRHDLPPEAVTRYRVLRRALVAGIVFVGVLSALLVIPQVRAIAGGVLASSAVVGLVVGFASQRTIGNLVAGVMIAITQPLRLGDAVEVQGVRGVVEEIGLTYTWLRTTSGRPARRPERKARLGYDPELHDPQSRDDRGGDGGGPAGAGPGRGARGA